MMRPVTIGRIHDIDIRIHPTFALVVLWVIYHWGIRDGGGLGTMFFGLLLVGFVFICVLLHELGHGLMALQYGMRVHDITLVPFGGVARIEMPMRPTWEASIAIAGPAINVAIAMALLPLLLLLGVINGFDSLVDYIAYVDHIALSGVLVYLFFTNIMIVLFNLLPAFPMDGGRLVRAGLTTIVGRERATKIAVILGQVAAIGLAIFGIWIGDYILPLIALFIIVAAYAEGRAVRVESAMRRLRVGQFALWDMGGISAHHPLTYALRGGPRDWVVTDGSRVVGMLWRHQLLHDLNGGTSGRTVGDLMDRDVTSVDVDDSVYDVQQRMHEINQWALPVTEGDQYRGIFTADRFVHVYRYLNAQSLGARSANGFAAAVANLFRGWVR